MDKRLLLLSLLLLITVSAIAQRPAYEKLSPWLRHACGKQSSARKIKGNNSRKASVCAFVQITTDSDEVLQDYGCTPLARFGNILIADIPLQQLSELSRQQQVRRIEAGPSCQLTLDTATAIVQVPRMQSETVLPQAYTGKGVVMGVQDVGFDLTHPTFYDTTLQECRIRRFWDQLSPDTLSSSLYVGAEYTTPETIARYARSHDGLIIQHGCHTLGIAAGTGYDTPYRGVAYESDICLVSNAVVNDTALIRQEDRYRYTTATDVLGFKYIFDYASEQDKPCVISFSEGEREDIDGECQLLYAALDSLAGPGRIIVASAGNNGANNTYFRKEPGEESKGAFLLRYGMDDSFRIRTKDQLDMQLVVYDYGGDSDTLHWSTDDILTQPDSIWKDTLQMCGVTLTIDICAYPYSLDKETIIYDYYITSSERFGYNHPISFEIIGKEATGEFLMDKGNFVFNELNPALRAGDNTHTVLSPSTAPRVISVGSTAYRTAYTNVTGNTQNNNWGTGGERAGYSSIGPTLDDRVKPEVVAPGTNILSAMSSYYHEAHPEETSATVAYSDFNDRRYPWAAETGTSMSTPLVAGIIACWLQAKPDLSPEDIIQLFKTTCKQREGYTYPNNEYGYGEIDAYQGLLQLLGLSGIRDISHHQPQQAEFLIQNHQLTIRFHEPSTANIHLCIYTLKGERTHHLTIPQGTNSYTLTLPLPHGVYAVQLNSTIPTLQGSTLIRW